jgi:hypothetical protein
MSTLYPKHRNKAQSIVNKRLGTEKGLKSLSVKKQFQRIRDEEAKKYQAIKFQPTVLSASQSCDFASPQRHQVDVAGVLKGAYLESSEARHQPTPREV